jgi:hypothetical protein
MVVVTQSNLRGTKLLDAIKADTSTIKSIKNDTSELRTLFASKMKIDVDDKAFSWLSATDMKFDHANIKKKRQPDTGLLFINGDDSKSWKTGQQSFIWLYGISGCGKTVLRLVLNVPFQKAFILPHKFLKHFTEHWSKLARACTKFIQSVSISIERPSGRAVSSSRRILLNALLVEVTPSVAGVDLASIKP